MRAFLEKVRKFTPLRHMVRRNTYPVLRAMRKERVDEGSIVLIFTPMGFAPVGIEEVRRYKRKFVPKKRRT